MFLRKQTLAIMESGLLCFQQQKFIRYIGLSSTRNAQLNHSLEFLDEINQLGSILFLLCRRDEETIDWIINEVSFHKYVSL
jgi:hypothetical protein